MKCSLWTWLLLIAVVLLISKNRAERCSTSSFNNAQVVVYKTDYFSVTISVSGCIAPFTLKAIGGDNVRRVFCDDQNIPYLREQAISGLSNLQTIRVERSGITTIESGAFTNLPLLRYVYLTENQIESLNENIFVDVPKLQLLSFHKNNLQYFDKSWLGNTSDLEVLDLSYNVIEFIAGEAFLNLHTLRVLNVEHNNIRHVTEKAFDKLLELETLDLSYNKINRLLDNLFASTTKLSTLNLFGNSLTYISEKVLHSLRTVNELIISYNPWQCDCFHKITDWKDMYKTVELNSKDLKCEKITDISDIAVCVTSTDNEIRCVPNPREDLFSVYRSEQVDYHCSLVKDYSKLKERGDRCTTPNGEKVTCVSVSSCKVIFDAIQTRNSSAIEFAKQSQCGFDSEPLVCCGSSGYPTIPLDVLGVFTKAPEIQIENKVAKKKVEAVILSNFNTKALPDRTVCGLEKEANRVIGGEVTEIDEFPWIVALEYKSKQTGDPAGIRCGGSLINNRYIMTAAHCIIDREFQLTRAWLGEWQISVDPDCQELIASDECADPVQKINIKEEIPHPFYSKRSGFHDIGLLRLERDVEYTDNIRPICLPPSNLPIPEAGTKFTVAGWGANKNGTLSDIKLKMVISSLSNSNCKDKLGRETVSENQVCAGGEEGKHSCRGDSGGPLMRMYEDPQSQWYQEGVDSYDVGCSGQPTIYTRVSGRYVIWILNNIKAD